MTKLIGVRKPTKDEKKKHDGAEVVFVREDEKGEEKIIFACKCYESWQQWGEVQSILAENVDAVERWRHGKGVRLE